MKSIVEIFEKKGWALYSSNTGIQDDLNEIIVRGKASELNIGWYYLILPLAFRDSGPNEVWDHIDFLRSVNKFPKFRLNKETFEINGLILESDAIHLIPTNKNGYNIEIKSENIEEALKYGFLNNNIFYFPSIEKLIEVIGLPPQQTPVLDGQLRWEMVWDDKDGKGIAFPSEPSKLLYRGQVKRYQPCYPSMARQNPQNVNNMLSLSQSAKIDIIVSLVKGYWFTEVIEETPQFKWANTQNLKLNKWALAQHYELPTGLLDITQSIEVAAFFACCKLKDGEYFPVGEEEDEGIIYSIDYGLIPEHKRSAVKAIGQQVFPRPNRQWGWTYECLLGENFDMLPFVTKFIFKHNKEQSERVFKKFDEGLHLFPDDPFATVANKIKYSPVIPFQLTVDAINDLLSDEYGLKGEDGETLLQLVQQKISTTQDVISIIDDGLMQKLESVWSVNQKSFFDSVGFRLVRTRKDIEPE
jgi:hypothetical protein